MNTLKRDKNIILRLTKFEDKLIRVKANDTGLSVSEYLRRCALNKKVSLRLSEEEIEIVKDLKKFYNNFNSITNLLKKGDHTKMIEDIKETQTVILKLINKIYDK